MDSFWLVIVFGAVLGGFVQGLSGSNFGLVAMAIWAWALPPALTGPLGVLLLQRIDPLLFSLLVGIVLALWCSPSSNPAPTKSSTVSP